MSANSADSARNLLDSLLEEMGEPIQVKREAFVPMEENAKEKLKQLRG